MNTDKSEREELTIWGAVGPNGQLVKSSVGTFKSVAARWALRRGNYEVVKLGTIPTPGKVVEEAEEEVKEEKTIPEPKARAVNKEEIRREPKSRAIPTHRSRSLPEADMEFSSAPSTPPEREHEEANIPKKLQVDRSFFGRRKKRR